MSVEGDALGEATILARGRAPPDDHAQTKLLVRLSACEHAVGNTEGRARVLHGEDHSKHTMRARTCTGGARSTNGVVLALIAAQMDDA